jgi:argininosuccinate lyase
MSNHTKISRLWGTAFAKPPKPEAVAFAAGRDVVALPPADEVLIPYEIEASKAYALALADVGLITEKEKYALEKALVELVTEYEKGIFKLDPAKEDVQTNIESWLTEKLGVEIAGKIHTGRSRNEQCIVESILYIKAMNDIYISEIGKLISCLAKSAKKNADTVIPAYTHHQHATVTTLGNMFDAYASVFAKDVTHFQSWNDLEEVSPLGAAAGYGSTLPVDKKKINDYLKLKKVFSNPTAQVTFRGDAESTFVFNLAMFANHASSLAQTLILFSTKEFGYVTISDEYSTGSSIMPQKKNPDSLEVIKAKAYMCHGYLMSLLSLTKAPFIGYNRDLQWVKYVVNDAVWETLQIPAILAGVVDTILINSAGRRTICPARSRKVWTQQAIATGCLRGAHKLRADQSAWMYTNTTIFSQSIMEGLISDFHIPMRQAKIVVETAIRQVGPQGNLTRKVINIALAENGFTHKVKPEQFRLWTDPLSVAKKQMKKESI